MTLSNFESVIFIYKKRETTSLRSVSLREAFFIKDNERQPLVGGDVPDAPFCTSIAPQPAGATRKPTCHFGRSCFSDFGLFGNFEQLIGSTIQQQAQGLNIFILNGLGLVVHHFVEILITHTELLI